MVILQSLNHLPIPGWNLYEGVVHCKAFKRWIKIDLWHQIKADGTVGKVKIYASINLDLPATDLYRYYKRRFQIEFLYRDAKGHTGLGHSQSRNEDRMGFQFQFSSYRRQCRQSSLLVSQYQK